jgi:hypothetical protein
MLAQGTSSIGSVTPIKLTLSPLSEGRIGGRTLRKLPTCVDGLLQQTIHFTAQMCQPDRLGKISGEPS